MTKLKQLTLRHLRIIIALLTAISIAIPTFLFLAMRGKADENEGIPRLNFNSNNQLVVGNEGLPAGSYLKDINGKDYTYNLDRDYTKGDVLTYNPTTQVVTADHNPSRNSNLVNVTTPISADHITESADTITINFSGSDRLEPNTEYFYYDGSKYYMFSFSDETIGRINGDAFEEDPSNSSSRAHRVPEQNDKVQIIIDKESGNAVYSDDSSGYDRRTIYKEVDSFEENSVYVITFVDGDEEYILTYNMEPSGKKKTAYSTNLSSRGQISGNSSYENTVYNPYALEAFPFSFDGAPDFYDFDHEQKTYSEEKKYYDGTDAQLKDIMFSGTSILPEFQAIPSGINDYWLLRGYDLTSYTPNKTLGTIYNRRHGLAPTNYVEDLFNDIFLFDLFTGDRLYYFLIDDNLTYADEYLSNVDLKTGSTWKYENKKLVNDNYLLNAYNNNAKFLGIAYPSEQSEDQTIKVTRSTTGFTNKLYQMEDVYTKSELPGLNSYGDQAEQREYAPSIISYTNSSQSVDGLKTSKTVTETSDPDLFHVKLEGYMTSRSLKLPTTDIVLVLDTSGRMDDVLYKRGYRNLQTQTMFEKVSLSDITHDDMFDKHNPRNVGQIDILPDRDYTDNKYVEDPNSPGTYVYLAQTYTFRNLKHYYQYSFTSSTGAVYQSPVYQKRILGGIIGDIGALTFTRQGTAHAGTSVRSVTLDSVYTRIGDNKDKSITDNSTSLYNYANSSGGLYYRHTDGQYYPVTVERLDYDSANGIFKSYKYSVTIDGKTYTATYGNDYYGAKNSVFQGFKTYKMENGKLVVDLENSLPSKTLYTKEANSSVTRLQAMKESVEDLLININQDARTKGAEERVAVTTFSNSTNEKIPYHLGDVDMSDTRAVDNMISDIYGYTTTTTFFGLVKTKKARIDVGTASANTEFRTNSPEGNKRYEVVFTAGVPTKSNNGSLDLPVANDAIANTYTAKTRYGANVYTVGLFHYADESHTHGDYFYYNSHPWFKCTGKVGSTWGVSTGYSWFGDKDINPMDADVTNRMLNYMSSNYSDASSSGLSTSALYNPGFLADPVTYFLSTHGRGYRINRNYSRTNDGYYYGISPTRRVVTDNGVDNPSASETDLTAEELEARFREVFGHIAQGLEAPLTELDTDTMLVDGITDYYDFEGADKSSIDVYAANINTGARKSVDDNIEWELSSDKKTINVTGFNYSNHYIGGQDPAKLVVEFDIRRTDNFIGGNRVPTNTANSAILDKNGHLEEKFNIPAIDLYLDKDENIAHDQSVYYSCEADLTKAFNLDDANGKSNAYVDLVYEIYDSKNGSTPINTYTIYHGDSVGHWEHSADADLEKMFPVITEDEEYYVKCTVKPWLDGTIEDEVLPSEGDYPTSHIYVFKPHLSATDLRITEAQDVQIDDLVSGNIEWKHDNDDEVHAPDPTGAAPALEYKLKDLTHNGTIYNPFAKDGNGNYQKLDAVNINETTDFQIVDLQVAPREFQYEVRRWIVEDIDIEDEDGKVIGTEHNEYWDDVTGKKDRAAVSLTFDGQSPTAYYVNDRDINNDDGINTASSPASKGKYTVIVSKPFTLKVQKVFTGEYAVPDDVTINIKDASDTLVGSVTFDADDFNHMKSDVTTVVPVPEGSSLECDQTYTVSEEPVDSDYYFISFAATNKAGQAVSDTDQDNNTFSFETQTMDDEITVVVTNTWNNEKNPPITGLLSKSRINPFIVAAAIVALGGGAWFVYLIKRRQRSAEQ